MFLLRTRMGKAMRAVSDNRDLAESSGIDVNRVITFVWAAGAVWRRSVASSRACPSR